MSERFSIPEDRPIVSDPEARASIEARNALRQFDMGMLLLMEWLKAAQAPQFKPSHLLNLNRVALEGLDQFAGTYRPGQMKISGSNYEPPPACQAPALIEELCEYLNRNWEKKTAVHLSAYVLWRVNWIHPFIDGNGRTARILSYIVLCLRLGHKLPGRETIPEQISRNKQPYYSALESADRYAKTGVIDTSALEELMEGYLATQLLNLHREASSAVSAATYDAVKYEKDLQVLRIELKVPDNLISVQPEESKNIIERNPVVFTALFGLLTALITLAVTLGASK